MATTQLNNLVKDKELYARIRNIIKYHRVSNSEWHGAIVSLYDKTSSGIKELIDDEIDRIRLSKAVKEAE